MIVSIHPVSEDKQCLLTHASVKAMPLMLCFGFSLQEYLTHTDSNQDRRTSVRFILYMLAVQNKQWDASLGDRALTTLSSPG